MSSKITANQTIEDFLKLSETEQRMAFHLVMGLKKNRRLLCPHEQTDYNDFNQEVCLECGQVFEGPEVDLDDIAEQFND